MQARPKQKQASQPDNCLGYRCNYDIAEGNGLTLGLLLIRSQSFKLTFLFLLLLFDISLAVKTTYSFSIKKSVLNYCVKCHKVKFYPCSLGRFSPATLAAFFLTFVAPWEFSSSSTSTLKDMASAEGRCLLRLVNC